MGGIEKTIRFRRLALFLRERLVGYLREQGFSAQEVEAVLDVRPAHWAELPRRLAALRGDLIDRLDRQEQEQRQGPPPALADVVDLLGEVVAALYHKVRGTRAGIAAALQLFKDDLELDPAATRAANSLRRAFVVWSLVATRSLAFG